MTTITITELISLLQTIESTHGGGLKVCIAHQHEYWGTVYDYLEPKDIEVTDNAQPNGPKKDSERALVFDTTH